MLTVLLWLLLLCCVVHLSVLHQKVTAVNKVVLCGEGRGRGKGTERSRRGDGSGGVEWSVVSQV